MEREYFDEPHTLVVYDLTRDRPMSRQFPEQELEAMAAVFSKIRYTEQYKWDYVIIDTENGEVVGIIRDLN